MKSSKTYKLIHSLTKKELKIFTESIQGNTKRLSLLQGYLAYFKNSNKHEFKSFYAFYYKKKYNKSFDNVLRNEFRLLNRLLEDFIIKLQFNKAKKENYYFYKKLYLNHLLEKNVLDLFEKEILKVFKRIDEKEDYFDFYPIFELWTKLQNKKFSYSKHYFKESKEFYHQGILKWFKEVSFKTRKLELFISFIERTNKQIEGNIHYTEPVNNIDVGSINNSNYMDFINKKIKAFKTYDFEKLRILIDSLKILRSVNNSTVNKSIEEFSLLQAIGVEYMLHGDNKMAVNYFQKVTELHGKIDDSYFVKGLYNYLNVEVKLKNYSNAIELFKTHYHIIQKSNLTDLFKNVIAICYLFVKDVKSAYKLTTIISSSVSTENNIYARCNIAMIHFLENNRELALTELNNIYQSISYYDQKNKAYIDFITNFKQYIHLLAIQFEIKDKKSKFKTIKVEILKNIALSNEKYDGDSLHNLWLLTEIEQYV